MDADRFDGLARLLTGNATRRALLGSLRTMALGGALARPGFGAAEANKKNKNRKRKKTPSCPQKQKPCGGRCIPESDCCASGARVTNGAVYRQCGKCDAGTLVESHTLCLRIDPDGCSPCKEDFQCHPGFDGRGCPFGDACGTCQDGLCQPGGSRACANDVCCRFGTECCDSTDACCPPNTFCDGGECKLSNCPVPTEPCGRSCCTIDHACCPQLDGPAVCRRPNASCDVCQFLCGDQCCAYASFNSCCRDKDGEFHCGTAGASC